MKYPTVRSNHQLLPKSLGGSDESANVRRVNDNFHRAFHRVFENKSPVGQIATITNFNSQVFTLDFCVRVNELLKDAQDLNFVYRKGVLVPREVYVKEKQKS
jgi:hypothetical protein